jgi:integrase
MPTNTRKVRKGLWRARLTFPKDPVTGIRPTSKDFYGATESEAVTKRTREAHAKPGIDKNTRFQGLLLEFIDREQNRYEAGSISWGEFRARKSRITEMVLVHPIAERFRSIPLANLHLEAMESYFQAIEVLTTPRKFNDLREDLFLALRFGKHRIPSRPDDYFCDIKTRRVIPKQKKLFEAEVILQVIGDETKPLMARLWVATMFILRCRMNETWALRWSDIDFKNQGITFDETIRDDKSGPIVVDSTKTGEDDSRAGLGVPMNQILTSLFKRAREARKGESEASFIFSQDDGKPHTRHTFNFERIRKDLGLPIGPTPYSLKTLGISYLASNNVPDAVLARGSGHKNTRMVRTTYRNVFDREMIAAVEVYQVASSEGYSEGY